MVLNPLCFSLHAAKLSSDKIKLTARTLLLDMTLPDVSTKAFSNTVLFLERPASLTT